MEDVVRCPSCGAAASIWAGFCPACDADLSEAAVVVGRPTERSGLEPPMAEPPMAEPPMAGRGDLATAVVRPLSQAPRAPHRKRRVATVTALAVVLGIAAWATLGIGRRVPAWPSGLSSRAVIELHDGRLYRFSPLDPEGTPEVISDPSPRVTSGPIQVSGEAVMAADGRAYAFSGRTAVDLGQADEVIPNVGGTAVWLVRTPATSAATVTLVAVTAINEQRTVRLPANTTVLADAGPGLLVRRGPGPPMVWDVATGRVLYRFPGSFRDLVATGDPYAPHVAWRDNQCRLGDQCVLHLTDLDTHRDQILSPPPGYDGFLPGGAFSPDDTPLAFDDTVLAALVADPHHGGRVQVDLLPTPNPAQFTLSNDLPGSGIRGAPRSAQWAPPGAPEGLFVAGERRMAVLDSRARMTTIALPPSARFAVL